MNRDFLHLIHNDIVRALEIDHLAPQHQHEKLDQFAEILEQKIFQRIIEQLAAVPMSAMRKN